MDQQLRQLAETANIGTITSIEQSGSGYASTAYTITTSEGVFIALTAKPGGIAPPNYANGFAILKGLETTNYQYAPRAVHLSQDQASIIMTAVAGEPIDWVDSLDGDDQKHVAKTLLAALLDLHAVSFDSCNKYYHELTGTDLSPRTLAADRQHYHADWFAHAAAGQPDETLRAWLEPKIQLAANFVNHAQPGKTISLIHGDTSNPNILVSPALQLHLIDWDGSAFHHFPDAMQDFGLAYVMNHVGLFQRHRDLVLQLSSERCQMPIAQLQENITRLQEYIQIGDINWAYMMNARAAAGQVDGDPANYLNIAQERIAEYERRFGQSSLL
ncbi:MAG TPA: phosphotransferase [Candidatus Saccharimonadales bacterium]|nr:phosphotransferase [Candidatus Saccharimonadales bacterium]